MSGQGQFVERLINATFELASGNFAESGTDTVNLSGLRISTDITTSGEVFDTAEITIYGMTLSLMNQLSTLGMRIRLVPRNTITLTAGDAVNGMVQVFSGNILYAYAVFNAMPQVAFRINAQAVAFQKVAPAASTSIPGSVPVSQLMSQFAQQMGLSFENNGVNNYLSNPHYYGSVYSQAAQCARAAGINWVIDSKSMTLAIAPRDQPRTTGSIPLVAPPPDGNMIGYPDYTAEGIKFRHLFVPDVTSALSVWKQVQVQSSLPRATGTFTIFKLEHHLESMVFDGNWHSDVLTYDPNTGGSPLP